MACASTEPTHAHSVSCCLSCCVLQVEAFDTSVNLYGQFAFLLWRSVYITKQVGIAGAYVMTAVE